MEASGNSNNNQPPSAAAAASQSPPAAGRAVVRTGSPPWTQIVRGAESDPAGDPSSPSPRPVEPPASENPPESSDNGNAGNNNKKPAWNKKPSNGSVDSGSGPVVMGAASWPALSESTKVSAKLSSSDSSKNLSDSGSASSPQVAAIASSSSSPLASPSQISLGSPKPTTSNVNHTPFPNHGRPARQKSMKRDGGSNAHVNGGFSYQNTTWEGSGNFNNSYVKPSAGGGFESSGRDRETLPHREAGQRNAAGGDHPQQRNSFRRGNGGPHSRGDGPHQNYGGRRGGDQDRGNHDWNHQRSFNGRDAPQLQPRGGPRGYVRTPPVSAPFVHAAGPAPMAPFLNPMGMPDMSMVFYPTAVPFVPPPVSMYIPTPPDPLMVKIISQIEYYFSNENLCRDTYLRQNMDEEGWVHVGLIAGFKKVMQLTDNIQQIMDAVRYSSVVEAQGDKIRKRDDWKKWIMPRAVTFPTASGSQSPQSPNVSTLSEHLQSVTVDEKSTDVTSEALLRSSSGDLNSPSYNTKDGASSSGC